MSGIQTFMDFAALIFVICIPNEIGTKTDKDTTHTQMTSIFEGQASKTRSFSSKTRGPHLGSYTKRSMLFSDDAATLECKYAAQQWLQSEDPLIRDFGARLQSILASKKMQEWTFIIHDLFITSQHIIYYIIYYIYIYISSWWRKSM